MHGVRDEVVNEGISKKLESLMGREGSGKEGGNGK